MSAIHFHSHSSRDLSLTILLSLTTFCSGGNNVRIRLHCIGPKICLEEARPRGDIQGDDVVPEDEGEPGAALGLEAVLHALAGGRHARDEREVGVEDVGADEEALWRRKVSFDFSRSPRLEC